jgi:hypothetical protein
MQYSSQTMKIAEAMGYYPNDDGILDMLKEGMDFDCPGICKNCEVVYENVEPDARNNHCESCGSKKVVSVLVLNSII